MWSAVVPMIPRRRTIVAAAAVALAYLLGAKLGFLLTFHPEPVSTMWPPNAILLASLLLAPMATWPILLLAVFPAHLAIQMAAGVPVAMLLGWFVTNCSEALIGALCIRRAIGGALRFDDSRHVGIFILGSVFATFASSFIDAGWVTLVGWGEGDYWHIWQSRFFSNVLTSLTLVPTIVTAANVDLRRLRRVRPRRIAEAAALAVALLLVCIEIFARERTGPDRTPGLLYVPLPFLFWAAVRFGAIGTSSATLAVALLAIWGAVHDTGPFRTYAPRANALSIQLTLIFMSIPLMLLSAVTEERRRAQREAILNGERLKVALDAARMTLWDSPISPVGGSPSRAPGLAEAGGSSREVGSLDHMLAIVHPEDRPGVFAALTRAMETGSSWDVEFRAPQPGGGVKWMMGKGEFERDAAGRVTQMFGVCVDITDRKQTDEALRKSEERFSKAFRGSPVPMAICRQGDGRIIDVNDRSEALFGYARSTLMGKLVTDVVSGASAQDAATLRRLIGSSRATHDVHLRVVTVTHRHRDLVVATEAVEMGGVPCFIMMMRDITERQRSRREMEEQREQLTHLSRVAMLGELSGALAHELSQPLMSILSNAQAARRMLVREPVDLDEIRDIIDDVIASDQRAGDVIRGLRAMLKRGESNRARVDVNEVVHDVLKLAHSDLLSRHVDVITHLDDAVPGVSGDSVQLRQVLLNLIVNACEAMTDNSPGDRVLMIETTVGRGDAVEVAIRDNGCGIPDEIRNGLFKPFVTTKRHGLGLGLSICRSIVEAHGGKLWCDGNDGGRGTAFHLSLPAESRLAPPAA